MNKILRIQTFGLVPHEKNPRKVLGDLEELTASIKQSGIHQPLTVVETDTPGVYRVIMGHRRLQAAINAGYDSVPCIVVEMTEEEQLEAMLVENMQRTDLTILEQAKGIQQCIDFGTSIDDIAKKTGFSKTTIRNRTKILELDQNKVQAATNATMDDYLLLDKVKDVAKRNKLLDLIGTNNFNLEVEKELQKQQEVILPENESSTTTNDSDNTKVKGNDNLHKKLRVKFMRDIFISKNTKEILAQTVFQNTIIVASGNYGVKADKAVFSEITRLPDLNVDDAFINSVNKNKTSYFIANTYSLLEGLNDIKLTYSYLEALGYVLSDEEREIADEN